MFCAGYITELFLSCGVMAAYNWSKVISLIIIISRSSGVFASSCVGVSSGVVAVPQALKSMAAKITDMSRVRFISTPALIP